MPVDHDTISFEFYALDDCPEQVIGCTVTRRIYTNIEREKYPFGRMKFSEGVFCFMF